MAEALKPFSPQLPIIFGPGWRGKKGKEKKEGGGKEKIAGRVGGLTLSPLCFYVNLYKTTKNKYVKACYTQNITKQSLMSQHS